MICGFTFDELFIPGIGLLNVEGNAKCSIDGDISVDLDYIGLWDDVVEEWIDFTKHFFNGTKERIAEWIAENRREYLIRRMED